MNRRELLIAGILALGIFLLLVPFARMGVDPHHDGAMLKPAMDVLSGQVLFRDTFSQYGALTTYLHAAVLWLWPTLFALKLFTAASYGLSAFFLYLAWREFLPRNLAVLSCAVLFFFLPSYEKQVWGVDFTLLPWSSAMALLFQAIGLLALMRIVSCRRTEFWAGVLGACCGAICWCRLPVGVTTTGGVFVIGFCLLLTGWRPSDTSLKKAAALGLLGFLSINLIMLASVVIPGATEEWWYQNFVWPGKWAGGSAGASPIKMGLFFRPLQEILWLLLGSGLIAALSLLRQFPSRISPWIVWGLLALLGGIIAFHGKTLWLLLSARQGSWALLVPLAVAALALVDTVRCFARRNAPPRAELHVTAAAAGYALASLAQYFPIADPWHAFWALGPGFGIAILAFWRTAGIRAGIAALVLMLLMGPAWLDKWDSASAMLNRTWVDLREPAVLTGMRSNERDARLYAAISAAIKRAQVVRPHIPIVLIGRNALWLCFSSNLENPTPLNVTWPGLITPKTEAQRWAYIQKFRPLVVADNVNWELIDDFYRRDHYAPLLYFHDFALEIGAPQELLQAAGVPAGGIPLPTVKP